MEELPIRVTDEGMTVIDEKAGKKMRVATAWQDLGAFEDLLVQRLSRVRGNGKSMAAHNAAMAPGVVPGGEG